MDTRAAQPGGGLPLWVLAPDARPQEDAAPLEAAPDQSWTAPASAPQPQEEALAWSLPADERAQQAPVARASGIPPAPVAPAPPVSVDQTAAIYADPRFQQMTDRMEKGEWSAVMPLLQTLQKQYAGAPLWEPLLNEAQLRLSLTAAWEGKIKGRRLSVPQARLARRSFPYLLLSILILCGWLFYGAFVATSRATVAMSRANQALVAAARDQFQSSQFADAMYLYDRVLQSEPDNQTALQGRADAKQQLSLATWYDLALQVAQAGNVRRALVMLATIQQESPTFRDVDAQIKRMQGLTQTQALFAGAEAAYQAQNWLDAVRLYEAVRAQSADYQAAVVSQHAAQAYLQAAQTIVSRRPVNITDPELARTYFRKAGDADRAAADAGLAQIDAFTQGQRAQQAGNTSQAISLWQGIYAARSDYLGGYLADQLYRAYLDQGAKALAEKRPADALSSYQAAAALPVHDTSAAQAKVLELSPVAAAR